MAATPKDAKGQIWPRRLTTVPVMAATPDDADLPEDRELFEAARACLRQHGIVRHQTESFDHFLSESLPLIVQVCVPLLLVHQ